MKVSLLLGRGQAAAVPMRQLSAWTGFDCRTIRRMIEAERREGTPICADNYSGYYLAADKAELTAFVRSMRHRAGQILTTARALEVDHE